MKQDFAFKLKTIPLDEHYRPSETTRTTTNFANLARGKRRKENLRNTLEMINTAFNSRAYWDNREKTRYRIELEIVTVEMDIEHTGQAFPSIEILKTNIFDSQTNTKIEGIVGNNFSSYVRDYDFSILLSKHNQNKSTFSVPDNFGELHGKLFQSFVNSATYKNNFKKPPVICLSVSDSKVYQRTENRHPVLGIEYQANETSLTEQYFHKMGLKVRYFMPPNSVAPLAFYFVNDLFNDYTNLELISTISTMETFQKIYRPEIYNANEIAGHSYRPSLNNSNHIATPIVYDREERSQLGVKQGKFAEKYFIKPYQASLEQWSQNVSIS